ncbi:SRPBCC family protein [Nocardioides euryhalodurans]|uniref:Polyketide cyclase n=1 Tax=Nocardioides euryhalodurans TaxID=2518370 RepID=A0A4P7GJV5_9ACTN|nr:SRPBCC family protein [Nocardioides euryhalodurans]QBR92059.1 polyketide cyclase [Nocardioides euryhalodurans]
MTRRFTFHADWVVDAPPGEVQSVLVDLEHYPDWWPQVLAVAKVDDDHARVLCRSTLPYTLDLLLTAVHREQALLETTLGGDLVGTVRWRLTPAGGGTRLAFEQEVVVGHRLLAVLAGPLAPLLRWNHHRMMAGCLTGLRARLG